MNKKILVVEDEQDMRELIALRLNTSGYEVMTAADGEEGMEKLAQARPDLIILDLMLPGIGGYELCWRLKGDKAYYNIPILIFSARAGDLDKLMGNQCGADGYVTKPFDGEVLVNRIEKLLKSQSGKSAN